MRRYLNLILLIGVLTVVGIACQKGLNGEVKKDVYGIDAVKEWYYGTFKKSSEWSGYNSSLNKMKLPDWKHGTYIRFGDKEIVEFPLIKGKNTFSVTFKVDLPENEKRQIANAAVSRVLFIKQKSGNIIVREIQYIPDMDYLSRHGFDISRNKIGDMDKDFSGTIIAKKWNGQEVARNILKNGKIIRRIKPNEIQGRNGAMRTASCPAGWIEVTEYARDCESHLYGDGLFTYECGEWYPTGAVWCYPPENGGTGDPECADPGSVECFCHMIGGCDGDPGDGDDDEGECNLSVEDADNALASVTREDLNNISYTDDSETSPDIYGIIRKAVIPKWEFLELRIAGNYRLKYSANFAGIVYRSLVSPWKWESINYQGPPTRTGLMAPCFSVEIDVVVAQPIISTDESEANVTSLEYDYEVSISCLGGLRTDSYQTTLHNQKFYAHH